MEPKQMDQEQERGQQQTSQWNSVDTTSAAISADTDEHKRWLDATNQFVTYLTRTDVEDCSDGALDQFVLLAKRAAGAASARLYLPSVEDKWICEAAAGSGTQTAIGSPLDVSGDRFALLEEERITTSPTELVVPIVSAAGLLGALVFAFDENRADPSFAVAYAQLGALALNLIASQQAQSLATLFEERERISRDLHDLGVQDLFATGMMLQALRLDVADGMMSPRVINERLADAMVRLEEAIRQIRQIVHRLKDEGETLTLYDALQQEASVARTHLGFAPTLIFEVDGIPISSRSEEDVLRAVEASGRVNRDLTQDLIAVVREALTNVARHAHARSARVQVELHGWGPSGEIEVTIVDDGTGVDPSRRRSSGIANMQRRAVMHAGSFAVGAGPRGRGTSLVWRTPLG